MVHFSIFGAAHSDQQRERIFAGHRLSVVVKINNVGFPEA